MEEQYFGKDLEAMSFAPNYHKWILDEIKEYLGSDVLEVGAGSGYFSGILMNSAINTLEAIEPSANMFPLLAKKKENILQEFPQKIMSAHKCTLSEYEGNKQFDSVLYINVLEHIEDDRAEITKVKEVLKSTGRLVIYVPALSWLYGTHDESVGHFRRYHKKGLMSVLRGLDMEIVKVKYVDIAGIVPWFILFRILKFKNLKPGQSSAYDRFVVPILRKLENLISPPIGKNLLVIAKKKNE